MNLFLFATTVLIWGTSWLAISAQVGSVPVVVSVFYRFALAGGLLMLGLALTGRLKLPEPRHQPWLVAQALCLFSLNFLCFYNAETYISSGLVSIVFSLATIFNSMNARIFFGDRITLRAIVAGALGVTGLACLFAPDLQNVGGLKTLSGLGLAVLGTYFFSLGNMVSRRNATNGLSTVTANAWAMCYGAIFLLALIATSRTPLVIPREPVYLAALFYLAVFGSIAGFTAYLLMVARIGSTRAAYATVLFPIVALSLSTILEGYRWGWLNGAGLALALLGNVVMFTGGAKKPKTL